MTEAPQRSILIAGDWVVDEYWFLVRHHSEIASHTGFTHYRLASKADEMIRDLCGAGHVVRVLNELREQEGQRSCLVGVGNWHELDQQLISHLAHPRQAQGQCAAATAAYHLMPRWCDTPANINLIAIRPESPTIRVIRLYHREKGGLEQINRVDWEPPPPPRWEIPVDFWPKLPSHTDAIVVYDLGKGVVSDDLIEGLNRRFPQASWYVRSKLKHPAWLATIEDRLSLLIIGPEVTALANPLESLLVNGKVTLHALNTIRDLPGKIVALLSDRREAIVRVRDGPFLAGQSGINATPLTQLGWASALFAALAWQEQAPDRALDQESLLKVFIAADGLAGVPEPDAERRVGRRVARNDPPSVTASEWKKEVAEWNAAMSELGLIERDGALELDVWRASTDLPGYIACTQRKREIVRRIVRRLNAFKKGGRQTRSLSIMLQSDPGAGKTTLAKALAAAFGFTFLTFDITQMMHRDDIFEMFDAIATQQANSDEKILVFIDEVNARIDEGHVFGSFLAPIEENLYVRRGRTFSLRPCAWIFVGTSMDVNDLASDEKFSDFRSRLTVTERIDFKSLNAAEADEQDRYRLQLQARLEQVYLGATMIRSHFSDVREVSRGVLEHFYMLEPAQAPARHIRTLAASLRNVQYGRVTHANCEDWGISRAPDPEWERIVNINFS
jgi:hypothetical protein